MMVSPRVAELRSDGRTFHLGNGYFSYVMHILDGRYLTHLYWGAPLGWNAPLDPDSFILVAAPEYLATVPRGEDATEGDWPRAQSRFSLDTLPFEYPVWGTGDQRRGAVEATLGDGTGAMALEYRSYEIHDGVRRPEDLPLLRDDHNLGGATTLTVHLADPRGDVAVALHYVVLDRSPALFRWASITAGEGSQDASSREGASVVEIHRAESASVDLPTDHYDMVTLAGSWARERHPVRTVLTPGRHTVGTRAGASSHQTSPFVAVCEPESTERTGEVRAMALLYSGSFEAGADVDQYGRCRMTIGIDGYRGTVAPDDPFQTPAAALVYSGTGFTGMSDAFHTVVREGIVASRWRSTPRKTTINTWEAMYFDLNAERIATLAQDGRKIGAELLVLDDGWFSRRRDDTTSLGDWWVNRDLFPEGLGPVADAVRQEGLEFGIWIEPEMVSPESDLYREHPEWILRVDRRKPTQARNQYTLDLSNPAVVDFLFETVSTILRESTATYVKWDMNRQMTEAASPISRRHDQGSVMHRYILGLYDLMARLITAFPHVLFEGCAGGGGRMDLGLAHFAPRFWTSDQTDAVERLDIQYGSSLVFPPEMMGAHVSTVPNHVTGRTTPAWTRVLTALAFSYGYELDPAEQNVEDRATFVRGSELYRRLRDVAMTGRFVRLGSPSGAGGAVSANGGAAARTMIAGGDGGSRAWMIVADDGSELFIFAFRPLARPNEDPGALRIPSLPVSDAIFRDADTGRRYAAAHLRTRGLRLGGSGDFQARLWHLIRE